MEDFHAASCSPAPSHHLHPAALLTPSPWPPLLLQEEVQTLPGGAMPPPPNPRERPGPVQPYQTCKAASPSRSRLLHSSALWPHTWLPASFRGQGPHHVSLGLLAPNTVSHMEQVLN